MTKTFGGFSSILILFKANFIKIDQWSPSQFLQTAFTDCLDVAIKNLGGLTVNLAIEIKLCVVVGKCLFLCVSLCVCLSVCVFVISVCGCECLCFCVSLCVCIFFCFCVCDCSCVSVSELLTEYSPISNCRGGSNN